MTNVSRHQILSKQRSILAGCLTKHGNDIKALSLPQVVFLQAVHDLELMRMQSGHPSKLLEYFSNESVNASAILPVLENISDKVRQLPSGAMLQLMWPSLGHHGILDTNLSSSLAPFAGAERRARGTQYDQRRHTSSRKSQTRRPQIGKHSHHIVRGLAMQ